MTSEHRSGAQLEESESNDRAQTVTKHRKSKTKLIRNVPDIQVAIDRMQSPVATLTVSDETIKVSSNQTAGAPAIIKDSSLQKKTFERSNQTCMSRPCSSSSLTESDSNVSSSDHRNLPENGMVCLPVDETSSSRASEREVSTFGSLNRRTSFSMVNLTSALLPIAAQNVRRRTFLIRGKNGGHKHAPFSNDADLDRLFPHRRAKIFVATWNLAEKIPTRSSLEDWLLPEQCHELCDVFFVAAQEAPANFSTKWSNWEVLLQDVIGPSHVLYTEVSMGDQHLSVFVRRELIWYFSSPNKAIMGTKFVNVKRAKGALAITFTFFGTTFLCLSSHLQAGSGRLQNRLNEYTQIISGLRFSSAVEQSPKSKPDVSSHFDVVFWCGDLNFRLSCTSSVARSLWRDGGGYSALLVHDELHQSMALNNAFDGFSEPAIQFAPTYKYDVGTSQFDSVKNRAPAYTDRILYRCKSDADVRCLLYNTAHEVCDSDHKPLFAEFTVSIRPSKTRHFGSMAHFKHDVYVRAMNQRHSAPAAKAAKQQSTVCNIQ